MNLGVYTKFSKDSRNFIMIKRPLYELFVFFNLEIIKVNHIPIPLYTVYTH